MVTPHKGPTLLFQDIIDAFADAMIVLANRLKAGDSRLERRS